MKDLTRIFLALLVAAFVAEASVFVFAGRPIIDEGVYLNAGRLVYDGSLPYRDFPFSQGPLVPYVYGAVLEVFGPSVLAGRLLSLALGLAGFGASVWLAQALAGRVAAAAVVTLSMLNLPMLWVSATVRTQSLSTPLTLLAVVALAAPVRGALGWALSPSLMLWSTSARLTNVLAFLAIAAFVGLRLRREPKLLAKVAGIVGAQGVLAFAPVLAAPREALFHIFTAQLGRGERGGIQAASFGDELAAKLSIFLEPETSFVAIVGLTLLVVGALVASARRGWRPDSSNLLGDPGTAQLTLITLALLVFVPHLLLDQGFLTYFVTSSALLVPAVAIGIGCMAREARPGRPLMLVAVVVLLVVGVAAVPRHRSAWVGAGDSSFAHFRAVARDVRALAGRDCTVVTMETALAVEMDCHVLPGLEYSLFSYFPRLTDAEALAKGVVNASVLAARIRGQRPELIVLGPRGRGRLRLPPGNRQPPTLGFLAPSGYTFAKRHRIPSGAFVRRAPDNVDIDVFVRDDLAMDRAPGRGRTP